MITVKKYNSSEKNTKEEHQIIWFEKASGKISIDNKEFVLSNNNIITVGKKQQLITKQLKSSAIAVNFTDSDFPTSSVDSVCRIVLLYNYFNIHNQLIIEGGSKEEFNQLFMLMFSEYKMNNTSSTNTVLSLLLQTLLLKAEQVIRNTLVDELGKNSDDEILLNQFLNKLESSFNKEHQVAYYADELNITTRKLNSITKTYLGTTTKDLIINRVYIEILKKLQFSSTIIKEIAFQTGFSSPYHLTNFFTKINGNSPLSYRENL